MRADPRWKPLWASWAGWAGFILGMGVVGFLAVSLPPLYLLVGFGGITAILLLGVFPEISLILFLIFRASSDAFQNSFTFLQGSAFGFNAAGLLNIAMVGIGLWLLFRRFGRGEPLLPGKIMKLYVAFLAVSLIGMAVSVDIVASLKSWVRLASHVGVALFALEALRKKPDGTRVLLRVVTIAAVPPIFFGYFQAITGTGRAFLGFTGTEFANRPQGTFGHPAILATFMIFVFALTAVAYIEKYPLWPKGVLLGFAGLSAGMLVLTYQRTQWLGFLVVGLVIGVLRYRRLLAAGVIAGGLLVLLVPTIQNRLFGELASTSIVWRLQVWESSLLLLDPPTLFGSGLDTSQILINDVLVNVFSPPHNDYLRTAIETGVVGASLYVLVMVVMVWQGWKYYRGPILEKRIMGLVLFAFSLAVLAMSVSDNILSYVAVQWYVWLIVGLLWGVSRELGSVDI